MLSRIGIFLKKHHRVIEMTLQLLFLALFISILVYLRSIKTQLININLNLSNLTGGSGNGFNRTSKDLGDLYKVMNEISDTIIDIKNVLP